MRKSARQSGKRGVALLLVIFAIAFISVLAVGLLDESMADLSILRNHTSGLAALYAAQAGVAEAAAALRANHQAAGTVSGTVVLPGGQTCGYSAVLSNTYPTVTVTSTGTAFGFTRKVRARLIVAGLPTMVAPYPVRIVSWQEVVGSG
jgi:Tfp pilus assembly protein PilX